MKQGLKRSAVIKVEDVRGVVEFLGKKSFNDNWRVVIVDSADDLNVSSANALLKILEEPPLKSILLLVSHNPGKLLPTIRSRCAKLALKPLQETEVASLLRRYKPSLKEAEVQGLAKIAAGSIGRALKYAENDALEMYENIKKSVTAGQNATAGCCWNWQATLPATKTAGICLPSWSAGLYATICPMRHIRASCTRLMRRR